MPKYFCEYCGIYLTHSSPGGRYQHSHGRKHINNKIEYYSQFLYEFQQNTYENLLVMAAKISQPQNPSEVLMIQPNNCLPTAQLPPGIQQHSSMMPTPISTGIPYQPPMEIIPENAEIEQQ